MKPPLGKTPLGMRGIVESGEEVLLGEVPQAAPLVQLLIEAVEHPLDLVTDKVHPLPVGEKVRAQSTSRTSASTKMPISGLNTSQPLRL